MENKRAQMKLSFGMIFSIILIIAFIVLAFYGIQKFLGFSETAEIGIFQKALQTDITGVWQSTQANQRVEYFLPSKIKYICIINGDYENLIYKSDKFIPGYTLNHVDLLETVGTGDEFCLENINGKVKMILQKDYSENLITIVRQ